MSNIGSTKPPLTEVRNELERLLKENAGRVMSLLYEIDEDSAGWISERDLRMVLEKLGFILNWTEEVHGIFDSIDRLDSFCISFSEMHDWLYFSEAKPVTKDEGEPKIKKKPSRPQPAATVVSGRPLWRPNGHRPSWPLDIAQRLAQERALLISPPSASPPRTPRSTRQRFGGYQPRTQICELRDIPKLKTARMQATVAAKPALPELYISRKLNWPPRGLLLDPQVTDRSNRVCATPRPPPRATRTARRPGSAR